MPKLSIITVNYNNGDGLQRTMDSVFNQTFKDFEYIIIDGGSSDGSKALIEKNAGTLAYWVSEKDNGIYSAMNTGIAQAKGEYLLFINSGDELINNSILAEVAPELSAEDIIYGNVLFVKPDKTTYRGGFPGKLSFDFFAEYTLAHPATFIRTEVMNRMGRYDDTFKICADWKFFMDAVFKENVAYKSLDKTIARFYLDGISSQDAYAGIIREERTSVLQKEYPAFLEMYLELQELRRLKNNWLVRFSIKAGLIKTPRRL